MKETHLHKRVIKKTHQQQCLPTEPLFQDCGQLPCWHSQISTTVRETSAIFFSRWTIYFQWARLWWCSGACTTAWYCDRPGLTLLCVSMTWAVRCKAKLQVILMWKWKFPFSWRFFFLVGLCAPCWKAEIMSKNTNANLLFHNLAFSFYSFDWA